MTDNEVIKKLRMMSNGTTLLPELQEACRVAIHAIEENHQYHKIGTVTECRVARKLFPMDVSMTHNEYAYLQERMSKKLKKGLLSNKEEAYNNGVLACKSILNEFYKVVKGDIR